MLCCCVQIPDVCLDVKIKKQFEEKVFELVDVGAPNLWGHFKDGVL